MAADKDSLTASVALAMISSSQPLFANGGGDQAMQTEEEKNEEIEAERKLAERIAKRKLEQAAKEEYERKLKTEADAKVR